MDDLILMDERSAADRGGVSAGAVAAVRAVADGREFVRGALRGGSQKLGCLGAGGFRVGRSRVWFGDPRFVTFSADKVRFVCNLCGAFPLHRWEAVMT